MRLPAIGARFRTCFCPSFIVAAAVIITACDGDTNQNAPQDIVSTDFAPQTDGGSGDAGFVPDSDNSDSLVDLPDFGCNPGSKWLPGLQAFVDETHLKGLARIAGVRLNAVDFNHDGFPDLVVRGYTTGDNFETGDRHTWLLLNQPATDGARTFVDVTESSGFVRKPLGGQGRTTHVTVWADVDNDGDLDAFSGVYTDPDPTKPDPGDRSEILLNNGDGTFVLGPGGDVRGAEVRLPLMGASFLDYDRDGFVDLWVAYGNGASQPVPDKLFRGDGRGGFTEVTTSMGIQTKDWISLNDLNNALVHRNSWGATSCDVNGDGWPDLLASSYGRQHNSLYLGSETRFLDVAISSGVAKDLLDNWETNFNAQCYCQLAPDGAECAGVAPPPAYFPCSSVGDLRWNHTLDREPFRLGGNTFSTVCADMDNDLDMDLVHFEIVHWDVGPSSDGTQILYNDGGSTPSFFRPGINESGLFRDWKGALDYNAGDMTGAVFDFDNDGRKDLFIGSSDYPGTRAFLFHQKPDGTFQEVVWTLGIYHPRSHGVAVADFDRDGDLDVVVGHGRARCSGDSSCYPTEEVHYFTNVTKNGNFLRIRLEGGEGSNRAAIGAKLYVTAGGQTQVQEISGGYGHAGIQNELVQHFGLGTACVADEIRVVWPDRAGTEQIFGPVSGNTEILIRQGDLQPIYSTSL